MAESNVTTYKTLLATENLNYSYNQTQLSKAYLSSHIDKKKKIHNARRQPLQILSLYPTNAQF